MLSMSGGINGGTPRLLLHERRRKGQGEMQAMCRLGADRLRGFPKGGSYGVRSC